jgi:hypothetical protein
MAIVFGYPTKAILANYIGMKIYFKNNISGTNRNLFKVLLTWPKKGENLRRMVT